MAIEVDTPANTDIVNVSTQTSLKSVLETQQILELLAEDLISEHRGLIDAYRSEYESRRASLAGNLEGMRIELARIENQVTELRPNLKNTDSSEATPFALALVELERAQSNYRTSIAETEKELYKITDSLLGIRETRGVSAPVVGTKPEGAGLLVVMLLAFMAGLVLSVLIALVLEFVTGAGATATPAKSPISTTD